ncbi:MAG TPA: DNA ligase [Enhygromyxa sp.]|nr:DNA ligase [Enhygromyxa sp.]
MRRFEYRDQKSNKFWEIEQDGCELITRWGRIDTTGQSARKQYPSEAKAAAEADKQIRSKTGKGYVEVSDATELQAPAKPKGLASQPRSSAKRAKPEPAAAEPEAPASKPIVKVVAEAPAGELPDGGETTVSGSGSRTYTLRNVGGAYSCTCPAWLHQSAPAERRTCKHLRKFRGDAAEEVRLGGAALPQRARTVREDGSDNAPPLLLAHRYEEQDPTGWWLSEKLDGVRAYWDGKQFLSRLGNAFLAPDWFIEGLPEFPLDGELFAGRGRFQHTVSVARRMDRGEGWRSLAFVIFDAPGLEHGFEDRIRHLEDHFGKRPWPQAQVLEHRVCKGVDDLHTELKRVEALGGEGVMLRKPGSRYVAGRSDTLLKVKSFLDSEARVVGHQAGTGKHKGRLGALLVELPNGTRFKVGTGMSDAERTQPPDVGEIITVRYQELTDAGVPRFPSYVGLRGDVDWEQLVAATLEREG